MASSRLERLFTLLATSTSGPTLSLASQQLAQVVRTHPEELCGLLAHLHPLLHSSTWETRLAAVQALTAILKAYPAEPRPVQAAGKEDARVKLEAPVDLSYGRESRQTPVIVSAAQVDQFNFETFDLARMIAETESLLSSRGREFNSPAQCDLGQQKKEINRKFGFTMAQNLAGDTAPDDLITEEDLKVENGSAGAGPTLSSALSARERNRLKRAASRQKTQVQTSQKKAKKEAKLYKAPRAPTDPDEWVFQPFCQYLCRDLFDEAWEVRHGAATALREIIAHQGQRAGCHGQHSAVENANAHRAWLAQISLRLITVMAKDRFGDFVSDQVVAPVRESSAQALAEAVTLMTPSDVSQVVRVILQLLANPDWQCRHGGLLGVSWLNDSVDDVVGVAAASLIPVVRELILKYQNQLEKLTDRLWDALKIIDDLTSSTHSIMHLLSEILKTQVEYGQIERLNLFQSNGGLDHQSMFALKVVRLFPFMSHSSSLVRKATLTTLNTLTEHQDLAKIVLPTVVKELSLNLFQRAVLEHQEDNLKLIEQIWNNMALYTPLGPLLMATCPMYGSWVAMVIQPPHWPFWIKYILATRQDLIDEILPVLYPAIFQGLNDSVDDGGRGSSLTHPVVRELILKYQNQLEKLTDRLWDALKIIDDLTSSTHSIMHLLSEILKTQVEYGQLNVVRLFPFMSHSSSLVRKATLTTLNTLTDNQDLAKIVLPTVVKELSLNLFQRAVLEHQEDNLKLIEQIWNTWPLHAPRPTSHGYFPCMALGSRTRPTRGSSIPRRARRAAFGQSIEKDRFVTRARYLAAKMLGKLAGFIRTPVPGMDYSKDALTPLQMFVTKILMPNLSNSSSAYQRMTMSLIVSEWYEQHNEKEVPLVLKSTFNRFLVEIPSYDETRQAASQLQNETVDYIALLKHYKLQLAPDLISLQPKTFSIDQVQMFLTRTDFGSLFGSNPKLKTKLLDSLLDRKNALVGSLNRIANDQATLTVMTQAANAGAIVSLGAYPEKLNPVIKPLMESIKRERNELLQSLSADRLVRVLEHCHEQHMLPPLEKVIKNLVNFVSTDPLVTPSLNPDPSSSANQCIVTLQIREAKSAKKSESSRNSNHNSNVNNASSSSSSSSRISNDDNVNTNGGSSSSNKKSGKSSGFENSLSVKDTLLQHSAKTNGQTPKGSKRTKKTAPNATNGKSQPSPAEIEESKRLQVQSRGAQMALEKIIRHFHAQVFIKLPKLHELTLKGVLSVMSEYQNQSPELVTCLRALEVSMPVLALDLQDALLLSVPNLVTLLKSPLASIRHMSARCLAILAKIRPMAVMVCVIEQILPLFNSDVVAHRQGAIECLACIVEKLDVQVLPYIALLVVPCMGRMSDFDQDIRLLASNTFAVLIRLIPLDGAVPEPLDLPKAIVQRKAQDQRFLDQLMNIGQLEDYQLAFPIEATLRSYQKNGLNWLAFLNRYRLHGILCDDMGLGKTLQTICMLASSHFHLQPRGFHDQSVDCLSLVICPPTLCSHWVAEIHRFVGKSILQPLIYSGPLATRAELRPLFSEFNVIITSYDVVRNDVDYFGRIAWNYVILDEGHVIKNGRTKTTLAIKSLQAQHRLILSGTPIQNSVLELWSLFDFLELWSLFDFLMPGFLGSDKQFAAKYSRPIVASRDPKCSPKDQEAGALAMEALHRQVLPFILRRMKEDVLSDLPPKITQDYYCELSQIQIKLYEDFARTQSNKHRQQGDEALNLSKKDPQPTPANKPHIFQALQYLRKVCNHPKLVLNEQHPEFDAVMGMLQVSNSNLNDINHSGKLPALHDLLLQCGIGAQSSSNSLDDSVVVQHRALVFFQLKSMMDIVENDLLKRLMPSVTYLRLDGSVPAHARQGIVDRFNNDISYDLLLLSTSVGGLGLNLTGADTVIFVEHDWNPMKDLQAMDRAHRIGQKKVVNVYRLITRNTIEEKILGLQKFKMITANTVISSDNASLHSMATDQIFDLFSLEDNLTAGDNRNGAMDQQRQQQQQGIKALLDNMPELWDERQYEDEYDLNAYISKKHASNGKEHASHPLESPSTSKEVHHSNNQTLN
ncbi:LOW QUALITY PROTEIN: TATA-binding protein-associated factor 172-like [Tigriopus californicus]|uniref:LOW QUALITY PROTEIN: TATA-binding protein-associated factor 172-like n=1 Tax=Tigriopus californicus TaxID=6832 RepID=UPI0027DA888D|nr:LOW QUALITY PROTEIN: TATA-binding protein-associated factor 172-like [Tigriopus californicus]